jgi:hypothetical protein
MHPLAPLAVSVALVPWLPAQVPAVDPVPLDDARVDELLERLRPDRDAPWRSLPWQTDLLAAQRLAAKSRQPLFVWAMDGHPLGCT